MKNIGKHIGLVALFVASVLLVNQGSLHQVIHHGVLQTEEHEHGDDNHHHELGCKGHDDPDRSSFCMHESLCEWCTIFSSKTFYTLVDWENASFQLSSQRLLSGYLSPLLSYEIDQPATRGPPAIA
ncbi:MAG: hypothetical protein LC664_15545 [Flavobacteriales bacterium]|nr:hypothetical protein [Flavobacteriales bacterium]